MTKAEADIIAKLRRKGYAVIVWTPDELGSADPERVEDRSIELGWDIIAINQEFAAYKDVQDELTRVQ
jgi:hypothetical protein